MTDEVNSDSTHTGGIFFLLFFFFFFFFFFFYRNILIHRNGNEEDAPCPTAMEIFLFEWIRYLNSNQNPGENICIYIKIYIYGEGILLFPMKISRVVFGLFYSCFWFFFSLSFSQ